MEALRVVSMQGREKREGLSEAANKAHGREGKARKACSRA